MTPRRITGVAVALLAAQAFAQGPPPPAGPARSGQQGALADFTGYWVSLVTEDWRYRMVTPAKGDANGLPLTADARKAMEAWDPAKDEAAGEMCKAYGAPGLMRRPTRLHITWQDDNTLKVETDEGTQVRLLHFNSNVAANEPLSLQGYSAAVWQGAGGGRGGLQGPGSLKVVTTRLQPGYLRTNGVPYDSNTTLTEYFTRVSGPAGASFLILTSAVEDPLYIRGDYLTSTHYLREPDGAKWDPSPCRAR
jgi:hypothetical protein